MTTEFTRENRIKKMDLKIKLLAVELSALLIILGIFTFIVQSTEYSDIEKGGISVILTVVLFIVLCAAWINHKEINDIFKD